MAANLPAGITRSSLNPVSTHQLESIRKKIDGKTKPLGALGRLEEVAARICCIQDTLEPELRRPTIMIFAGDHGITQEGVSPYPQEVTFQMVKNFLNGGAAINVFARQNNIELKIIDAGVNHSFEPHSHLVDAKIACGTRSFLNGAAMSLDDCEKAFLKGMELADGIAEEGCNIVGFGEMGIGNTSSSAALMSTICDLPIDACVGRGTGLSDEGLQQKRNVLARAVKNFSGPRDPWHLLAYFGGFELAMMGGAMLRAAQRGAVLLVDGFCVSAAFLVVSSLCPSLKEYAIFCHRSDEQAHGRMLEWMGVKPLLDLNMRLGEGTGAAVALPVVQCAVAFMRDMSSFESAAVSTIREEHS